MDFDERQRLYNRIITGFTIVLYNGKQYCIYDPRPQDFFLVESYYQQVYLDLLNRGIPSSDDISALLVEKKLWSDQDAKRLDDYRNEVRRLHKQLPELEFRSNDKKIVLNIIKQFNSKIKSLEKYKASLVNMTAEYLARIEKYKKLIYLLTKDDWGKPIWSDWDSFISSDDHFISRLLTESYFNENLNDKNIRELARSEPWRSIWISAIKVGNLFHRPMVEVTDYQRILVSWSLVYDNAFESMEPPSMEIVENDELFDQWLEDQADKRKREAAQKTVAADDKIANSQEVGIIVDTYEDAQRVYSLNNAAAKSVLKSRENILSAKGETSFLEMPDIQQNLRLQINQLEQSSINNRMK